ncbi:peptide-binding protein [Desulfoluna limicola]|uniref:Peptide-binding protein n=1 Tax=Desulfoluna limicola TaxID=2810562 RepID=A0ABM7PEJ1_9BACT|nr:ABC transporter substrate-binding protein [Desulfoluna limicola]BCS95648.1 peptide-binding protein [Desulfoluna limicola]
MKRMLKFLTVLSAAAVLCAPSAFAAEKVLKVGIAKEPAKLNPVLIPGIFGESLASNIFDTLISFKESASEPAPGLAESWTIAEDGKTYTFTLRKGVTFHNGMALTSADVKYTLEALLDKANASPSREFFTPVEKIDTPDAYTVVLHLKAPYGPLLFALGNPTCGILPAEVVKEVGMDAFDRKPIGTGPFKFVEWVPDERIVLVKNADYFLGTPKIDKVIFRPIPKPETMAAEIEAGGIDVAQRLLPQDVKRLSEDKNLQVLTVPGLSNDYLGFSYTKAPFSDVRFRKAVYAAIPFDAAINGIWRGVGERSYSWIPSGVFPEDTAHMKSRAIPFDRKEAKRLFDELKKEGILTEGFSFSIYTPQNPQRVKMATAVATELRKYGITAKVESLEWATLFPILKEGAGMYIMGWGSVPDPDRWTYKIFHSGSTMNFSKYELPEIDQALEMGRSLSGADKRGEQYKIVMRKALGEDYIHIPLVFKSVTNVVSSKVKGYTPSAQDYLHLVSEKRNVSID